MTTETQRMSAGRLLSLEMSHAPPLDAATITAYLYSKPLQLRREVNAQLSNGILVIALCAILEDGSPHFLGMRCFLWTGARKSLISFTG